MEHLWAETQLGCDARLLRLDLVGFGILPCAMAGGTFEVSLPAAESGPVSGLESGRLCDREWT